MEEWSEGDEERRREKRVRDRVGEVVVVVGGGWGDGRFFVGVEEGHCYLVGCVWERDRWTVESWLEEWKSLGLVWNCGGLSKESWVSRREGTVE